jgi:hypothetical protein
MERVVEGSVTVRPAERVSQKGNRYCLFVIKDKDSIQYHCRVFREQAERALQLLSHGEKVVVSGKVDTTGEDDIRTMMVNSWGFLDEDKQKAESKKITKRESADSIVNEEHKVWINAFADCVWIRTKHLGGRWVRREHCVTVGNQTVSKLDFLLMMFGKDWEKIIMAQNFDFQNFNAGQVKKYRQLEERFIQLGFDKLKRGEKPWLTSSSESTPERTEG